MRLCVLRSVRGVEMYIWISSAKQWWWSAWLRKIVSMSSAYAMNFFGPRTDPCGTPWLELTTFEDWPLTLWGMIGTKQVLSLTQKRQWRICRSSCWSTVSKIDLEVQVLPCDPGQCWWRCHYGFWPGRFRWRVILAIRRLNRGEEGLWVTAWWVNLESIVRSRSLETKLRLDIGRNEFKSVELRLNFLRSGRTMADFWLAGNLLCTTVTEALHIEAMIGAMYS